MTMSEPPVRTDHQDDIRNIEIRRFSYSVRQELGNKLDRAGCWKEVMASVKDDCDPKQDKFSADDIGIIEKAKNNGPGCGALFLEEWGTMGPRLPKVWDLIQYLEQLELLEASTYLRKTFFDEDITPKNDDTIQKWVEKTLKEKEEEEKQREEKRRKRRQEKQEEKEKAEDLMKRQQQEGKENKGKIKQELQIVNNVQLEAGVFDNCIGNDRKEEHDFHNGAFDGNHLQKDGNHLKETIPVGTRNNHLVVKQSNAAGIIKNVAGNAKPDEDRIGIVEVHKEPIANVINAHKEPVVGSNNGKRVSFGFKVTPLHVASIASERDIQGVLIQETDVSNIGQNDRIEEEEESILSSDEIQVEKNFNLNNYPESYSEENYIEDRECSKPKKNINKKQEASRYFSKPSADLIEFSEYELEQATNGFNDKTPQERGNKIGEGAYGKVYYGKLGNGTEIAVKTLHREPEMSSSSSIKSASPAEDLVTTLFKNEVRSLAVCKHTNLIQLLGYFVGVEMSCIVYEFMANGSLYDRLACMNDTPPLSAAQRCSIALDVAEALNYLHTGRGGLKPIVHRDVKSMNILLNDKFEAKLGDFGIVRPMSTEHTEHTNQVAGTWSYMAPESHYERFVSTKTDVFAYGIVLLEILTGLKPQDNNLEPDLKDSSLWVFFVYEQNSSENGIELVKQYLDVKANWDRKDVVDSLVYLAQSKCCAERRTDRPTMREIVDTLRELNF